MKRSVRLLLTIGIMVLGGSGFALGSAVTGAVIDDPVPWAFLGASSGVGAMATLVVLRWHLSGVLLLLVAAVTWVSAWIVGDIDGAAGWVIPGLYVGTFGAALVRRALRDRPVPGRQARRTPDSASAQFSLILRQHPLVTFLTIVSIVVGVAGIATTLVALASG